MNRYTVYVDIRVKVLLLCVLLYNNIGISIGFSVYRNQALNISVFTYQSTGEKTSSTLTSMDEAISICMTHQ